MKIKNHSNEGMRPPILTGYADTYIKLAQHRIIVVSEDITDVMATELSALLLYFDNENHEEPIEMYIHSNGGATSGLTNIYDVMQMISAPVHTVCLGKCYSAGAVLLAAGSKGERYAMKHSSVMIHGIQAGFPIPGYDIKSSKNYYEYLTDHNDTIMKMLARHTGHSLSKVKEDCKQDVWMDAHQALNYGLVDHIIE